MPSRYSDYRVPTAGVLIAIVVAGNWLCALLEPACADDAPAGRQVVLHQVTGLFSVERVAALRQAFDKLPQIKLLDIDFDKAEIRVEYDPQQAFPGAKPEQIVEQFNNALRGASNHTLGIKPLCKVPADQLTFVEIPVVGLDCLACSLAAYEVIYQLPGVERATASFKEGRVTAWITAETTREKLEAALQQREVTLKKPAAAAQ